MNLLADVFEEFRRVTLREDGLDPVHFVSLPSMSYTSAFKMTRETIDLIQDAEMYTTFERGIRGGLTFTNKHCVTRQVGDANAGTQNVILGYIDQNNLYGSSLCRPLPHSEFKWLTETELEYFRDVRHLLALEDDADYGYLFEVDLDYPSHLHDTTADFPLAPESGEVRSDMFSPFMESFYQDLAKQRGVSGKFKACRKL